MMKTYWNGGKCIARRVTVIVADAPQFDNYWARKLVDTQRFAVEIVYDGRTFYIDNEYGQGWYKVTEGFGSPSISHKELMVKEVISTMVEEW